MVVRGVIFALLLGVAASARAEPLTYTDRELDCRWLSDEYTRVLKASKEEQFISWQLKLVRVLTYPLVVADHLLDNDHRFLDPNVGGEAEVDFSGSISDIQAAARLKNCYYLADDIINDRKAGKHEGVLPEPVTSMLDNAWWFNWH